ncbi:MAG: hypothetical protein BWY49_00111 [Candidatus Omnitrophica bacterium ADurb.Bin314]|nr:MAG: hypothetical protein BWY49_00111 [Candidatus Omnitrophica bacterium ADurb.Bin314]
MKTRIIFAVIGHQSIHGRTNPRRFFRFGPEQRCARDPGKRGGSRENKHPPSRDPRIPGLPRRRAGRRRGKIKYLTEFFITDGLKRGNSFKVLRGELRTCRQSFGEIENLASRCHARVLFLQNRLEGFRDSLQFRVTVQRLSNVTFFRRAGLPASRLRAQNKAERFGVSFGVES